MSSTLEEMRRLLAELPIPGYVWEVSSQRFVAVNARLLSLVEYSEQEMYALDWRDLLVPGEISIAERAVSAGMVLEGVRWYWRTKSQRVVPVVISSHKTHLKGDGASEFEVRVSVITSFGANVVHSPDTIFRSS